MGTIVLAVIMTCAALAVWVFVMRYHEKLPSALGRLSRRDWSIATIVTVLVVWLM